MTGRPIVVGAVLAALAAAPSVARAEPTNAAAAEALFPEGGELLDRGSLEEACDRFRRSQKLDPAVGTLLNLGECYERLGRFASAWTTYGQAASLAIERRDERRADLARKALDRVTPRLARLTIHVAARSQQVSVTRGGVAVDEAAFDTAVPVDPGPQKVEATAEGHRPFTTTVIVGDGATEAVTVPELAPLPPPSVAAPDGGTSKVVLGLEIGGGAAIATGLVFGGLTIARWNAVTDACPNASCPTETERQRQASDADAASTFALVSSIATIAGVAAVAGGLLLHLLSRHDRSPPGGTVGAGARR